VCVLQRTPFRGHPALICNLMDVKHVNTNETGGGSMVEVTPPQRRALPVSESERAVTLVELKQAPVPESVTNNHTQIKECLKSILDVFRLFGYVSEETIMDRTYSHWCTLADAIGTGEDVWMKLMKYKLAAFCACHLNQPLPPRPFPSSLNDEAGVLIGGKPYRYQGILLNEKNAHYIKYNQNTTHNGYPVAPGQAAFLRKLEFLSSISKSKKGMPRANKSMLESATKDAFTKLTTAEPDNRLTFRTMKSVELRRWGDLDSYGRLAMENSNMLFHVQQSDIVAQLQRTVQEIFRGHLFTDEDRYQAIFPSTSANYQRSRSGGGAVAAIFEAKGLLDGLRTPGGPTLFKQTSTTISLDHDTGLIHSGNENILNGDHHQRIPLLVADYTPLETRFKTLWQRLLVHAHTEEVDMEVLLVALAESLKIRIISKGPAATYTVLKSLQMYMHRTLRKHPAFALIGEEISPEYIQLRMGPPGGSISGGPEHADDDVWHPTDNTKYLSGDFKDATNNIKSWVSDTIVHTLSSYIGLSSLERELFESSLTGHTIVHPTTGEPFEQRTGQLMGSVTSFPILCIANAALARFAWEQAHGRRIDLVNLRAAFNGDDMVMRCDRLTYQIWKKIVGFAGLQESVGKTYFSQWFLQMNSRMFAPIFGKAFTFMDPHITTAWARPKPRCPLHWMLIHDVDMGLVNGMTRSTGKVGTFDAVGPNNIGSRARDLYHFAPDDVADAAARLFVYRNYDVLITLRVPWFAPEWIGGVGLPAHRKLDGTWFGMTDEDLEKAQYIRLNWRNRRPERATDTPWNVHRLVQKRLPKALTVSHVHHMEPVIEASDRLYGKTAIGLLFDSSVELKDLFDPDFTSTKKRVLRHNERLWADAKRLSLRKPREELISELLAGQGRADIYGVLEREVSNGTFVYPHANAREDGGFEFGQEHHVEERVPALRTQPLPSRSLPSSSAPVPPTEPRSARQPFAATLSHAEVPVNRMIATPLLDAEQSARQEMIMGFVVDSVKDGGTGFRLF